MRKWLYIAMICMISAEAFAQPSYYARNGKAKSFVGLSYGIGTTRWYSVSDDYNLFDPRGNQINSGDFKFNARNSSQSLQIETLSPMSGGKWRFGMGIQFEEYSLYRVTIEDDTGPSTTLPFVERFRFDKFFMQGEIPLKWPNSKVFSLNVNMQAGWYGFTGVRSTSLFGEDRLGETWFGGVGAVGEIHLSDLIYLVCKPMVQYKYFINSRDEEPGRIRHRMFDYSILAGVRVHVL